MSGPAISRHNSGPSARTYLLFAVLFLAICCAWDMTLLRGGRSFWDARVYAGAIAHFRSHVDPYAAGSIFLPFVYPPLFLKCAAFLASFLPPGVGWFLYLSLLSMSALAIPWILATTYIRSSWLKPVVAFIIFAFEPRLFGEMVLLSGNIGSLLYFVILLAGIPGIRRDRWQLFYLAVITASLVKPNYLLFLLLPLFVSRAQILWCSASTAVVAAGYGLQFLLMPQLYKAFQSAVATQVLVRRDAGFGILSYLLKLSDRLRILRGDGPPFGHILVLSILVGAFFLLRGKRRHPDVAHLWRPAILVLIILANPRLQSYDVDIALVPAAFICVDSLLKMRASRFRTTIIAGSLAAFVALLSKDALAATCLLLLSAVVLTILRLNTTRQPAAMAVMPSAEQTDVKWTLPA